MQAYRLARHSAAGVLVALSGSVLTAEDYDPTGEAGEYAEVIPSTLARGLGGTYDAVTLYCPWLLDESDGFLNAPAVQNVGGEPLGAVSSSGAAGTVVRAVAALGTVDIANPGPNGPALVSNNVFLDEGAVNRSNPIGTMLSDGTLVWREAFSSAIPAQNNLGYETISVLPQEAFPEGTEATGKVFDPASGGIDGTAGSVFLGPPGAIEDPAPPGGHTPPDPFLAAVTTFNAFGPDTINGVGVYRETAGGVSPATGQVDLWEQVDVTAANGILPTGETNGTVRQTQPVLASVLEPLAGNGGPAPVAYCLHGIGISGGVSLSGGSAEPYVLAVDVVGDGDRYGGAVFIEADGGSGSQPGNLIGDPDEDVINANPAIKFRDHQATGGGGGPFTNSLFDINSSGQVAALLVDEGGSPVNYDVVLYDPIFSGGRIVGYSGPTVVATNGADGIEEIVENTILVVGIPTRVELAPFSGIALDDSGRVSFVAVTEKQVDLSDPLLPILEWTTNSLFVWTPPGFAGSGDESLNIVAQGGQNGDTLSNTSGGRDLALGFFAVDATDNSDSFARSGMSRSGGLLAVNFRSGIENDPSLDGGVLDPGGVEVAVRGTVIIDLGAYNPASPACDGDANGDGSVDVNDISYVIFRFGTCNLGGTPCPNGCDGDANGDGSVDVNDISYVIFRLGTCNPQGFPCEVFCDVQPQPTISSNAPTVLSDGDSMTVLGNNFPLDTEKISLGFLNDDGTFISINVQTVADTDSDGFGEQITAVIDDFFDTDAVNSHQLVMEVGNKSSMSLANGGTGIALHTCPLLSPATGPSLVTSSSARPSTPASTVGIDFDFVPGAMDTENQLVAQLLEPWSANATYRISRQWIKIRFMEGAATKTCFFWINTTTFTTGGSPSALDCAGKIRDIINDAIAKAAAAESPPGPCTTVLQNIEATASDIAGKITVRLSLKASPTDPTVRLLGNKGRLVVRKVP